MAQVKIYCDEIPDDIQTEKYIFRKTKSWFKWEEIKNQFSYKKMVFKIEDYDHEKLKNDTIEVLDKLGFRGWKTKEEESKIYGGLSFVYNPNQVDGNDPESSTLGAPKNSKDQFFWNTTSNYTRLKNSYFDSYGFNKKTQLFNYGYIKEFLESRLQRTMIRSRLGVLKNHELDEAVDGLNWHRDEVICQNLRINIPILTTPDYMFQMENEEMYHLEIGKAYTWDTNIPHRVVLLNQTPTDRIHFVLGCSPWFDYDEYNRCWVQNEFWGKHPFQMLLDGDIFKGLTFEEAK